MQREWSFEDETTSGSGSGTRSGGERPVPEPKPGPELVPGPELAPGQFAERRVRPERQGRPNPGAVRVGGFEVGAVGRSARRLAIQLIGAD
ncbi:hypothetical protein GCM10009839_55900 [Catenulispora yoronensis]|uniref:Uncharacterized protein n=1 Tax=Catenulispora yoronensis TaxID=450799 RepID=A0ABP5GI17_9ACTN